MKAPVRTSRYEPRWPVALAVAAVVALFALIPGRIRLMPIWVSYALGIALLVPIAAVGLTHGRAGWMRVERTVTLLFFLVSGTATVANLVNIVYTMAKRSEGISGLQLLVSSVGVWVANVISFSLLYWQMDRGGPEARLSQRGTRTDWLFPQVGAPTEDVPADWRPAFVDYLFLSYSTATAFSTTDVIPLTARAKLLMMLESTISLVTIIVVAGRAINIFGN